MSSAMERRVAPRFAVKCRGELASGTAVRDVSISDISVTGCGLEITDETGEALDGAGVLSIRSADAASAVMLPVTVSNQRVDGETARLGLQFRRLSLQQMRTLIGVMDGMISK